MHLNLTNWRSSNKHDKSKLFTHKPSLSVCLVVSKVVCFLCVYGSLLHVCGLFRCFKSTSSSQTWIDSNDVKHFPPFFFSSSHPLVAFTYICSFCHLLWIQKTEQLPERIEPLLLERCLRRRPPPEPFSPAEQKPDGGRVKDEQLRTSQTPHSVCVAHSWWWNLYRSTSSLTQFSWFCWDFSLL